MKPLAIKIYFTLLLSCFSTHAFPLTCNIKKPLQNIKHYEKICTQKDTKWKVYIRTLKTPKGKEIVEEKGLIKPDGNYHIWLEKNKIKGEDILYTVINSYKFNAIVKHDIKINLPTIFKGFHKKEKLLDTNDLICKHQKNGIIKCDNGLLYTKNLFKDCSKGVINSSRSNIRKPPLAQEHNQLKEISSQK